jgi:Ser/Thr protein kinase RdoA (MazF antagonist)
MIPATLTPPTATHLANACALWQLDAEPVLLRKVASFVYEARRGGTPVILRLTEPAYRSVAQLVAELDFAAHLAAGGAHVAAPIPSSDGRFVEVLCNDLEGGAPAFHAALFERAPGAELRDPRTFSTTLYEDLGATFGRMHRLTRSYEPPPGLARRAQWRTEAVLASVEAQLARLGLTPHPELIRAKARLAELPQPADAYALVHADLHHGNFFVADDGRITVFDFDDCCYHWFAYDLVVPLLNIAYTSHRVGIEIAPSAVMAAILTGYEREHRLDRCWIECLPEFYRYRLALVHHWCDVQVRTGSLSQNAVAWCRGCHEWTAAELDRAWR